MGKWEKLLDRILRGDSDAGIAFEDLRRLLIKLGFDERIRGSHHLYRRGGIEENLNLQRDGHQAKPYQVKAVRTVILRNRLGKVIYE